MLILAAAPAAASLGVAEAQGFSWGAMLMGLFGGLALFLLGLDRLTESLKAAAGSRLQSCLERLTNNRFSGALVGALTTAMLQSSSVTTVLVVGFVSAGVMSLSQSVGVIMGANIGSTVTAQIIAFNVSTYALSLVAAGFAMLTFARREQFRHYGGMLLGLGLIFFGMGIMTDAMVPLRAYPPFLEWMVGMESPFIGLLVGALFTALIQSSAATTGLVIIMASQGFISLPAGITLALGANIGTCVTAMLATIGKPLVALRAATIHVLFNVAGVLLWLGFVDQLAALTVALSPQYGELQGMDRLAAEAPRQIANANTLFNVLNTFIFIALAPFFARLAMVLVPERKDLDKTPVVVPKYLDERLLDTPAAALNLVRMEIGRLGQEVVQMTETIWPALQKNDNQLFREVQRRDDVIDLLHTEIINYLSMLGKKELTEDQAHDYYLLSQAADTLERIGDVIESELVETGFKIAQLPLRPGAQIRDLLGRLHAYVYTAVELAVRAVNDNDSAPAQELLGMRREVNEAVEGAFRRQVASMAASDTERLKLLQLEFEITDKFKQIFSLAKRIARLYQPYSD
ncbi:Na/Pi cotransporter family protein [Pelobacter sp. M08fum]|uniref:Na/Pi cotransporter family protein n=2 Tax=Pelovirga terrestris TaxID=2771352 RepID=A0A8J6QPD7_9BACT|nr:Na/Pi cotransporter family protein [Pelovirga terrestris]